MRSWRRAQPITLWPSSMNSRHRFSPRPLEQPVTRTTFCSPVSFWSPTVLGRRWCCTTRRRRCDIRGVYYHVTYKQARIDPRKTGLSATPLCLQGYPALLVSLLCFGLCGVGLGACSVTLGSLLVVLHYTDWIVVGYYSYRTRHVSSVWISVASARICCTACRRSPSTCLMSRFAAANKLALPPVMPWTNFSF